MPESLLLVQLLNGVQLGILLFLVAAGLTLVFGVMDFINLAHGVQYMLGAYLAASLGLWSGSFWVGLLLTLPAAAGLGLLLELLVFRHLYRRDHLSQVLATFGVILTVDEAVRAIWGSAPLRVLQPAGLDGGVELIAGFTYPVYRLAIIAAGLGVALLLWVLVERTRVGMLVRAGATHPAIVSALGVDIRRLFTAVFGFGAMLAGFAGALAGPVFAVQPGMGDGVLILAFVVIVIGGIGSVRGAFIAALLVGLLDTLGRALLPDALRVVMEASAARQTGAALASMLVYIAMAVILCVRPAGLFPAGRARMSRVRALALPIAVLAALAAAPFLGFGDRFGLTLLAHAMILGMAATGLSLLVGGAGLVSLGQAAMFGVGAYTVATLDLYGITGAAAVFPAAIAAGALAALATGAVSLRTGGAHFIMITLAFGQMAFFTASSLSALGGDDGYTLFGRTAWFGAAVLGNGLVFHFVCLAGLIATWLLCSAVLDSRFGRVLRASRENETRAGAAWPTGG